MTALCAHMGASLVGTAISTRGSATKKMCAPAVACRSTPAASRACGTSQRQRGSVSGTFGDKTGVVHARGMRRGKVRYRCRQTPITAFHGARIRVQLGLPHFQFLTIFPLYQQVVPTAVPDSFSGVPGMGAPQNEDEKGFMEIFFGKNPNKGKVRSVWMTESINPLQLRKVKH